MSSKEFSEMGDELARWPSDWAPSYDPTNRWDGDWEGKGRDGERQIIETDDESYREDLAAFVVKLVNTSPKMLGHIDALESAIRETIPVLERAGRAVLATKLRKLVGG